MKRIEGKNNNFKEDIMKKYNRKRSFLVVLAVVFAFGIAFAAPALAGGGSTLFDDSTNQALSGSAKSKTVTQADVPCDPARAGKSDLSFLP